MAYFTNIESDIDEDVAFKVSLDQRNRLVETEALTLEDVSSAADRTNQDADEQRDTGVIGSIAEATIGSGGTLADTEGSLLSLDQIASESNTVVSNAVASTPPGRQSQWIAKAIEFLIDASPLSIASFTGATALVLMSIFGRVGCLVSGVLLGGLAHSSFLYNQAMVDEQRWKSRQVERETVDKEAITVCCAFFAHVPSNRFLG
jgi:hypothetical protein